MDSSRHSRSHHQRQRHRSRSPLHSPPPRHHHASRSPPRQRDRPQSQDRPPGRYRRRARSRSPIHHRSRKPLPPQEESYRSRTTGAPSDSIEKAPSKERPNFKASGLLAAETNKVTVGAGNKTQDIILKYHEPPEARKPPSREQWQIFVFKGTSKEPLETIPLYSRSCWLMGRELAVADLPVEHPTCSKQHAVFQFRHITKTNDYGEKKDRVGLYLLDLESSHGTFLNDEKISSARYVECHSGDVVKFAESSREYVLILPPKSWEETLS